VVFSRKARGFRGEKVQAAKKVRAWYALTQQQTGIKSRKNHLREDLRKPGKSVLKRKETEKT